MMRRECGEGAGEASVFAIFAGGRGGLAGQRGVAAAGAPGAVGRGGGGAVRPLVCALGTGTAAVGADVYAPPDRTTELAQFAQPADDLEPIEAAARAAATDDPATAEVAYVGSAYHVPASATTRAPPVDDAWGNRLPLPWYVASAGADATSTPDAAALAERYGNGSVPPVVVADPTRRAAVAERLGPTYEPTTYRLGLWNREVVAFVDREEASGGGT